MKITDIKIHLASEWRTFLFVTVHTDEGIVGIGEGGITSRELGVKGVLEHLKPLLIGQDPFDTEKIWQQCWRGGFFPSGQILSGAIAAIDIALWDIKGKALGVPVYKLLGGKSRDKVLTYCHLNARETDELVDLAKAAVEQGWKALRFEPNYNDEVGIFDAKKAHYLAIEQWCALRDAIGNDIELCFDAHTRLSVSEAITLCREIEKFKPMFVEDPIRSEHAYAYHRLRQQVAVPIAAGEQFANKWQFRELIQNQLIDMARIDLCVAGGITEAMKIAAMSETYLIDIAVHNPIGPVSTAACLHFNTAISNMAIQELPKIPGQTMPEVVSGGSKWEDGYLIVNEEPGLGIEFNEEALKKYPFKMQELPHIKKPDGSFTNW